VGRLLKLGGGRGAAWGETKKKRVKGKPGLRPLSRLLQKRRRGSGEASATSAERGERGFSSSEESFSKKEEGQGEIEQPGAPFLISLGVNGRICSLMS